MVTCRKVKFHRMLSQFSLAQLFACVALLWPTFAYCQQTREYRLTTEGVKLLQRIAARDQLVRDLPKGVAAFSDLNELFSKVPGPTILVVKWNEGLVAGWKAANKQLVAIGKGATCLDLTLYLDGDPKDAQFFKDLSKIRGCDDL